METELNTNIVRDNTHKSKDRVNAAGELRRVEAAVKFA